MQYLLNRLYCVTYIDRTYIQKVTSLFTTSVAFFAKRLQAYKTEIRKLKLRFFEIVLYLRSFCRTATLYHFRRAAAATEDGGVYFLGNSAKINSCA